MTKLASALPDGHGLEAEEQQTDEDEPDSAPDRLLPRKPCRAPLRPRGPAQPPSDRTGPT